MLCRLCLSGARLAGDDGDLRLVAAAHLLVGGVGDGVEVWRLHGLARHAAVARGDLVRVQRQHAVRVDGDQNVADVRLGGGGGGGDGEGRGGQWVKRRKRLDIGKTSATKRVLPLSFSSPPPLSLFQKDLLRMHTARAEQKWAGEREAALLSSSWQKGGREAGEESAGRRTRGRHRPLGLRRWLSAPFPLSPCRIPQAHGPGVSSAARCAALRRGDQQRRRKAPL